MVENKKTDEIKKYTKVSILISKKYSKYKDLLKVLLKDNVKYTFEEVDTMLDKYLKGKVK